MRPSPPEKHYPDNICRGLAHDPPDRIPSKSYAKRRCHSFNTDQGDRAVNTKLFQKLRRVTGLIAFASILIGCGLPSTGPNKQQIYSGGQASSGPAWVIPVTAIVNQKTAIKPSSGFASHFKTLSKVGADMIRAGDTLGLTIWENVQDQLLGEMGPTTLQTVQVDGEVIFCPLCRTDSSCGQHPGINSKDHNRRA